MNQNLVGKIVLFAVGCVLVANSSNKDVVHLGVGGMCAMLMVFVLDRMTSGNTQEHE